MWTIVSSFIAKLFSGPLLGALEKYYTTKANSEVQKTKTEGEVALAYIQADIEARKAQRDIIVAEQGWWVTAWIRPLICYPFILHVGAIALDSTFKFGWGIPKLPSPYDNMEWTIILSFFIARPIEKVANSLLVRNK